MSRKEIKIRIIDAGGWLTGTGRHEIPQGTEKAVKDTLVARCATNACGEFESCQPAVFVEKGSFSVWPSNKDTSGDKKRLICAQCPYTNSQMMIICHDPEVTIG